MNTEANASRSRSEPRPIVHKTPSQTLYWSIRRELWENRSIYIAPLIAAGVMLFGFVLSTFGLPHRRRALLLLDPAQQRAHIERPYDMLAMALLAPRYRRGVLLPRRAARRASRSQHPVLEVAAGLGLHDGPLEGLHPARRSASARLRGRRRRAGRHDVAQFGHPDGERSASGDAGSAAAGSKLDDAALRADRDGALALTHLRVVLSSPPGPPRDFLWAVFPLLAVSALERMAFGTTRFMAMLQYRMVGAMSEAFVSRRSAAHMGS